MDIVEPIHYIQLSTKKGENPKASNEDELQLMAQAMCLEEMFSTKK